MESVASDTWKRSYRNEELMIEVALAIARG
jgi:hypothetical protein